MTPCMVSINPNSFQVENAILDPVRDLSASLATLSTVTVVPSEVGWSLELGESWHRRRIHVQSRVKRETLVCLEGTEAARVC